MAAPPEEGVTRKFIKKVPPSGSSPAYKLTLPHSIVHRHLQHLIDSEFELASTPVATQTWQASIAPRRNKERSEYTLQGWKLFAEAHQVQAGDQVSFELVAPRRMLLSIIRPSELMGATTRGTQRSASDSALTSNTHSKSPKRSECSSPASEQPLHADFSAGMDDWIINAPLDDAQPLHDNWPDLSEGLAADPLPSLSDEGALSHSCLFSDTPIRPASPSLSHDRPTIQASMVTPIASPTERNSALRSHSALRNTPRSTTSFSSMTHEPICPLTSVFDNILDDRTSLVRDKSDAHVVDSFLSSTPSPTAHQAPFAPMSPGLNTLQDTSNQYLTQAIKAKDRASELRAVYAGLQQQLAQQTNEALRATMGLEQSTIALSSQADANAKSASDVQADMFKYLSALKGSLWQLLVMTMPPEH